MRLRGCIPTLTDETRLPENDEGRVRGVRVTPYSERQKTSVGIGGAVRKHYHRRWTFPGREVEKGILEG